MLIKCDLQVMKGPKIVILFKSLIDIEVFTVWSVSNGTLMRWLACVLPALSKSVCLATKALAEYYTYM